MAGLTSPQTAEEVWEVHGAILVDPMPEQRNDGGVIEDCRRGKPAELPGLLHHGEISVSKGYE